MYYYNSTVNISSYVASSSYPCKYHFDTSSYSISGYDVNVSYLSYGDYLEVYLEESQGSYTHKATLNNSGDTATVTMSSGSYDDMFIVLIPSGGANASFSVDVRTSSSSSSNSSSSSSSSSYNASSGLSGGAIAGIVIGSLVFIGFFVGLSIFSQYIRNKRLREQREAGQRVLQSVNQNQDNTLIISSQPQPQPMMMEPQPMIMQPQPMVMPPQPMPLQPLYNPGYASMYPGQPVQPSYYDPNMPVYPKDPSLAYSQNPALNYPQNPTPPTNYPQSTPASNPDPTAPVSPPQPATQPPKTPNQM